MTYYKTNSGESQIRLGCGEKLHKLEKVDEILLATLWRVDIQTKGKRNKIAPLRKYGVHCLRACLPFWDSFEFYHRFPKVKLILSCS